MAISDFQNFKFLTQNFAKMYIFLKNQYKIKNFQHFLKTGIYVRDLLTNSQHTKFQVSISIFDVFMARYVLGVMTSHFFNYVF